MGLRTYIAKRLINSLILIVLIICVNFAIFKLMPGDPTAFLMQAWSKEPPEVRRQQEQLIKSLWGLDQPFHIQLIKYIRNLLAWDFGVSIINKEPISHALGWRIPYTLLLIGGSTAVSIILGVLLGIFVIQRRGGLIDSAAVTTSLVLGSLPTFWLGLIFILIFFVNLRWFPVAGGHPIWARNYPVPWSYSVESSTNALNVNLSLNAMEAWRLVGGYLYHLFLPFLTLTVFSVGGWLLLTRATMLETITEDYVVTARAKGLKERTVLFKHALKNASLPIITSAALSFGFMFQGAIITETVFSYPGLGGYIWMAVQFLDYPVLMAIFYVTALCVVIANIIADLLYGVLDPRIKYG
ncbi:MAG: ABC transporter permease [Candidatus Bathyarchaeia archaeon]